MNTTLYMHLTRFINTSIQDINLIDDINLCDDKYYVNHVINYISC